MKAIYVDHAATTPVHPEVVKEITPYFGELFGNPSSIHGFGRQTRGAIDQARQSLAQHIGAKPGHLTFTSGGTEADNLALIGVAIANQDKGKHIITTQIEHHAVLHTCQYLEQEGFEVTYLPVNSYGEVRVRDLEKALREDTTLVSIMYGNNEVGTLQPIMEIGQLLQGKQAYFHTDAVQAFGLENIDVEEQAIDLLSASSHKVNGPKGIGFLYTRPDVKIKPLLFGGAQERNRRAGTENIAGIIGFAKAAKIAYTDIKQKKEQYLEFRELMLDIFSRSGVEYVVNGHPVKSMPHILNVSFPGVRADALLMNLDLNGIAASSGSACSAGSLQPSHVLQAMTDQEEYILSAIRYSFGLGNTREDIQQVAEQTVKIVNQMRPNG